VPLLLKVKFNAAAAQEYQALDDKQPSQQRAEHTETHTAHAHSLTLAKPPAYVQPCRGANLHIESRRKLTVAPKAQAALWTSNALCVSNTGLHGGEQGKATRQCGPQSKGADKLISHHTPRQTPHTST
jgi:hypothetical protein